MNKLESLFNQADFSKYSDLKERLGKQLFTEKSAGKTVSLPFAALSDDDLTYVNAAAGLPPKAPDLQSDIDKNK